MPATSRQAESGSTRSASGLAGSPSKSTIFQPLTVRSVWPRWRSPCTCCTCDTGRRRRRRRTSRAGRRRTAPARAPRRARRRAGPSSRSRARPAASAVRTCVGKCSARAWCTSASDSPRRAASAAKSPPTSSAWRSASANRLRTLASADVPAVAGGPQELLEHRQLEGSGGRSPLGDLEPAVEVGDVVGPGLGQHPVHRDVGVHARASPCGTPSAARRRRRPARSWTARRRTASSAPRCRGRGPAAGGTPAVRRRRGWSKARSQPAIASRSCTASYDVHEPAQLGFLPPADEGVVEAVLRARRRRRAAAGRARSCRRRRRRG